MIRLGHLLTVFAGVLLLVLLPLSSAKADIVDGLEAGPFGLDVLPEHAQAVVLTFVGRARGGDPALLAEKLGVKNAELIKPEAQFRYRGFGPRGIIVVDLSQDQADPANVHIAGHLLWKDPIGRRAMSSFEAFYRVEDGAATLQRAAWAPKYSVAPRVRTVVLPVSKAGNIEWAAKDSFPSFFLAATEVERATADQSAQEDRIVAAFLMDRVGPETTCDLRLSEEETGTGGEDEIARARVYEPGWGVLGTSLKASAFSADEELWLKVVCGEKDDGGIFSSPKREVVSVTPISDGR